MSMQKLQKFRARLPISLLVLGAMIVAGLGSGGGNASATTAKASAMRTATVKASTQYKGTIGALILVESDEQGVRCLKAIEKEGAALGYKVINYDADYNPTLEVAGMKTFISDKVNGIISFATNDTLLAPEIKAAHAAGIPVISITGGPVVPGLTWSDDFAEAASAGALATMFFKAIMKGKERTAVEMVLPSALPCLRREEAFEAAAKNFPQISLAKYPIAGTNSVEGADSYFTSYFAAHPTLGGVISCWDIPLAGTLTAATADHMPKTFIAMGINGSSNMVALMQDHAAYLDADLQVALARAGYETTLEMADVLQHKANNIPASKYSTVQWTILTASNLPPKGYIEPVSWLPAGWSPNYWK